MKYRKLGNTDMTISVVGMGCWSFAGDGPWGTQDDSDSIAAVHAAFDVGVNFFDTAEGYGNGRSESVLGRALVGRRDEAIVATKVSASNLSKTELPKACKRSLERLQTDYIDLYQIHWPNPNIPIAESMEALLKLRQEGKIRAIGVCNFGVQQLSDLLDVGRCETNQMSYSLVWRALEYEIKPLCIDKNIGTICWGPLSEGLLTGKFASPDDMPEARAATRHFSSERPQTSHGEPGAEEETFAAVNKIRDIANRIGQPMAVVSLAWLLSQPGITAVLAGSRKPEQIRENTLAGDLELPPAVIAELTEVTNELKCKLGPNQDMYLTAADSRIL